MPLYWMIDSRAELVSAEAEGDVSLDDAMSFLRALSGAKVTHYRKLFDGRNGTSSMTAQELLVITAEIRSHHSLGKMGALAIVSKPEQTEPFARVLGALALADRPMRMFDSPTRARNWLLAQPRVSP
ncbi:MAG: hypothetical protein K2X72_18475 [Reyranella sp.]|nr:hypothetical protein [Reyranella sp.]